MPYNDITKINKIPRKIFVFICANISNPFESLRAKICVTTNSDVIKIRNSSMDKILKEIVIMKNQKDNPAVTAILLNLGEDSSNLNRVNECYQTTLS